MAQMTVLRRRMIDDMTGSQPLASNPAILRPAGGAGAAGIHPDPRRSGGGSQHASSKKSRDN
jgi:hypothetical protein